MVNTIYPPIQVGSGPTCPHLCPGHIHKKSFCTIFYKNLSKAMEGYRYKKDYMGYIYNKCPECLEELKRQEFVPEPSTKTVITRWTPPPDVFREE